MVALLGDRDMKKEKKNKESKIKKAIMKVPAKLRSVLAFSLLTISLVTVILSGGLNSTMFYEVRSEYISQAIRSDSVKGDHLSFIVESKDEEEHPMKTSSTEFRNTSGTFGDDGTYYASTVNADKTHSIHFKEIDDEANISVLYANVNSNSVYGDHYKHEYYPIELMFRGNHNSYGYYSFCYISQSQADKLLEVRGETKGEGGTYTSEQYESLIATGTTIELDGTEYSYYISNIYYQTDYYYEALSSTMGEFIMSYLNYPDSFKKQAVYFMNANSFENRYFMEYINEQYSRDHYEVRLNTYNVIDPSVDVAYANSFFNDSPSNTVLKTIILSLLVLFAILLDVISIWLIWQWDIFGKKLNLLILIPFAISPYFLFKYLSLGLGNIYLFSSSGSIFNALFLLGYLISCFMVVAIKHEKKQIEKKEEVEQ